MFLLNGSRTVTRTLTLGHKAVGVKGLALQSKPGERDISLPFAVKSGCTYLLSSVESRFLRPGKPRLSLAP
jgi:hypothetical protein